MEWFIYLLKVSACTGLFFLLYHFLLSKFTFFNLNRWYLLGTLLLSFVIPASTIEIETEVYSQFPILQQNEISIYDGTVNELDPEVYFTDSSSLDTFQLIEFLIGLYLLVTTILILKLMIGIIKIFWVAKKYRINKDVNYILVASDNQIKNSSFYKYLFIDENLSSKEKEQVIKHEQVHIQKLHFIDKLIANLSLCILWFNPLSYAYLNAIDANHEFEADENSSSEINKSAYASLILNLSQNSNQLIMNHFSKLPLKRRIIMLFKNPTIPMKKLMYLCVLPIVIGLTCWQSVDFVEVSPFPNQLTKLKDSITEKRNGLSEIVHKDSIRLFGKTIEGVITSLDKSIFPYFNIDSKGETFHIQMNKDLVDKIKVGQNLKIVLGNTYFTSINGKEFYVYNTEKVYNQEGKLIYQYVIEKLPFLYEVNKARFANSTIKNIDISKDEILSVELFDGEFTIILDLIRKEVNTQNFKIGDKVLVKFYNEKLLAKNTYFTDKLIVMYNSSKKILYKEPVLYSRFYQEDGKQKLN